MRARLVFGCGLVLALGCGSQRVVPVSGTVTMDGQPLAGAEISFAPIAKEGAIEAGPGSAGKTDKEGKFTLKTIKGESGAIPGKHRVAISVFNSKVGEGDERPRPGQLVNKV